MRESCCVRTSRPSGTDIATGVARALLLAAAALQVTACGGHSQRQPETEYLEPEEKSEADRYMPLRNDAVYRYDTRSATGETGMMTIQIRRTGKETLDLWMGGHLEHVRTDRTGIRLFDGAYILKTPLQTGDTWTGALGVVRVTGVNEEVSVPAGHFSGCLRTEERGTGLQARSTILAFYCPHVGLTRLDHFEGQKTHETAALRQFGPRIDPLLGVTPPEEDAPRVQSGAH
ncbi:MAG TPA: hypothetical protein VH062_36620 [Polyangiaceae bacterium]|jgi:hypothetical protein|nr:hypothetical protein [Polyangiaceae bacterium]